MQAGRSLLWAMIAMLGAAATWVVFSIAAAPTLIDQAYHGRSVAFLNALFTRHDDGALEHYLRRWETLWQGVLLLGSTLVVLTAPLVARAVASRRPVSRMGTARSAAGHAILVGGGTAAVLGLVWIAPVAYVHLVAEDGWAEYAAFVGLTMAGILFLVEACRGRGTRRIGVALLGLAAIVLAMEEISWGQRVVGIGTPSFMRARNLQGELTLHNMVRFGSWLTVTVAVVLLAWSVGLGAVAARWRRVRDACDRLGVPIVPLSLVPLLVVAAACFLPNPIKHFEEIGEMLLAIALATLALHLTITPEGPRRDAGPTLAVTAVIVAYVGVLAAAFALLRPNPMELRWKLHHFACTHLPVAGMNRQAAMVFEHIVADPDLVLPDTRLHQGRVLLELGEETRARAALEPAALELAEASSGSDAAEPARNLGVALRLLGRSVEADVAFGEALARDLRRLDEHPSRGDEARIRKSLAETHLASGDVDAALAQVDAALAVVDDGRVRYGLLALQRRATAGRAPATAPTGVQAVPAASVRLPDAPD